MRLIICSEEKFGAKIALQNNVSKNCMQNPTKPRNKTNKTKKFGFIKRLEYFLSDIFLLLSIGKYPENHYLNSNII